MDDINIAQVSALSASEGEQLKALLTLCYVGGGFTEASLASTVFAPNLVLQRGVLLLARASSDAAIVGCVIYVSDTHPGKRFAREHEAEVQLIAVDPSARGRGIGKRLMDAVVNLARESGRKRLLLWTQPGMHAAQQLYEKMGFERVPERDFRRESMDFLFMRLRLD
jgi:ribosomal protein S18 acetylase RimI-like enzyme